MARNSYKRRIVMEYDYEQVKVGVSKTSNQMKLLNKEYRAAKAEAKAYGDNVDQLNNRHKYLTERIKIVNGEIEKYKDRLEKANESNNSKAVENYTVKLKNAENELRTLQADLDGVAEKLEEQKRFLGKSTEEWENYADKLDSVGKSMSKKITAPVVAATGLAFKMASDYEQALGKSEVVFEHHSGAMEKWAENALETMNLSRATATTIASDFGALFKGMGFSLDQTKEFSITLTERVTDLANFYDTTIDETITALESIVSGQTQPLRKFGINMTQATLQEYAFANGISKKVSEMTEAEKTQLRYNFVMDRTAIAIGTTAREQDSANAQMQRFKETIKELGISFGEEILPLITPVISFLNDMLQAFAKLPGPVKKVVVVMAMLAAAIGPILIALSSVITATIQLKSTLGGVGGVVTKVGSGVTGAMGQMGGAFNSTAVKVLAFIAALSVLVFLLNILLGKGSDMERVIGSIGGTASKVTSEVQKAQRSVRKGTVHGSHASGLAYVPFDGYIAELHKGEAVVPAKDNPYNNGRLSGDTIIINANIEDYATLQKIIKRAKEERQRKRSEGGVVYA